MIILTVLCYFFSHFYSFPKIAVTNSIIYFGVQPMYYDSPKLHILASGGLCDSNVKLTPWAACEGGASHDNSFPTLAA
jgi:hypothetical protein